MNVFRKKSVEQTLAETGESGHALKRDLTWWDLAIMGVAVAVGAGIFSIGAQAAAFHDRFSSDAPQQCAQRCRSCLNWDHKDFPE